LKYTEEAFANKYGGFENAGKIPILQEGMTYQELQSKVLDGINERNSINEEICKLFGVPVNKIMPKNGASGRSLEQDNKAFLQDCLNPVIIALEEAINYTILSEKEKEDGYYFRFDTSEMLRATEKERIESLVLASGGAFLTINEARAKMDLPPIAGHDYIAQAPGTTNIDVQTGQLVGQGLNQPVPSANGSSDVNKTESET
jgi:HK97 family phage portal protein